MIGWLTTVALAAPYYETTELRARGALTDHALRAELTRELREQRLSLALRDRSGAETRLRPSSSRWWPYTAASILVALRSAEPGAEVDSVLKVRDDGGLDLVTVWWEGDRVVVEQGRVPRPLLGPGPAGGEIQQQYGAGELVGDWDPLALGLLCDALELLTPGERAAVAGLPYHRVPAPPEEIREGLDSDTIAAVYVQEREGARVEVYDRAVQPSVSFRGSPWDARHAALGVLVHELGHAIASAAKRDALRRIWELVVEDEAAAARHAAIVDGSASGTSEDLERLVADHDARTAAVARLEALAGASPVVDAWHAATGGDAPTRYGRSSPEEGFAESLMLHRVDPEALQRAAPRSFAWFEATDLGKLVADARAAVERARHGG